MMLRCTAIPLAVMAWGWWFVVQVSGAAGFNSSRAAVVVAVTACCSSSVYALSYWRGIVLIRQIKRIRCQLKSAGTQIGS
jgi:hypothetical protein